MSVLVNEARKQFHLKGIETSYIFHVDHHGRLIHDYYGKKIREIPTNWLKSTISRQWSPIPYEGDDRYGLDSALFECPLTGHEDFGLPLIEAEFSDGDRSVVLVYESYDLQRGKPLLEGLPCSYGSNEEVETLTITLVDHLRKMKVALSYSIFESKDVITKSVRIYNDNEHKIRINNVQSGCLDLKKSEYEMLHLSGAWGRERHITTRPLVHGLQSIDSNRGASSHEHNPFLAITSPGLTEDCGEVYGMNLVYSGNFVGAIEVNEHNRTRVVMGISPRDFSWLLEPGHQFQSPELVMVHSYLGLGHMSRKYHEFYNNNLIRGVHKKAYRPILINNWEATYFDFDQESIAAIASSASKLGIEMFVLDDGWFGKRNDDSSSLGDWFVNEEKLQGGLEALVGTVASMGMQFGLWFEPEMVSPDSELYRLHPDWVLGIPEREMVKVRNQFTLDLSREDVCDYIIKSLSDILSFTRIRYVKWDMNRYMTDVHSRQLSTTRQKEVTHRYILGLYRIMEVLTSRFPEVLFEGCAGGGGRFDPGILHYMPQIWTSDDTDAIERLDIQEGTSIVYPPSSISCHVSDIPNHQVGRETPLKTRGHVAMFGNYGYELNLSKQVESDIEEVKRQVLFYKNHWKLLQYGCLYRLTHWNVNHICAWAKVSKDQREAIVTVVKRLAMPNSHDFILKVKGLNSEATYLIKEYNLEINGDVLMEAGIVLPPLNDFESIQLYLKQIS